MNCRSGVSAPAGFNNVIDVLNADSGRYTDTPMHDVAVQWSMNEDENAA